MFTFRNYKNWAVHALNTHFFGACETILLAHIFLHCIDLDPPATTAQPTCLIMIMSISFHRFVQRKYWVKSKIVISSTMHMLPAILGNTMGGTWTWTRHYRRMESLMKVRSFTNWEWTMNNFYLQCIYILMMTSQKHRAKYIIMLCTSVFKCCL